MSDITIGSNTKICGTCDYFICDREPKLGGFVVIKKEDGKCYLVNSLGVPRKVMYTCGSWKKWGVLK